MNIEALKISQHTLQVTSVYSVANAYYHCVVDVNPRFLKLDFLLRLETFIHIWRLLERGIESCLATCKHNYFNTGSVCPFYESLIKSTEHESLWKYILNLGAKACSKNE